MDEPRQNGFRVRQGRFGEPQLTGGQICRREANRIARAVQGAQIVVASAVEQIVGERRAGSDGLHHFTLDDALGKLRIFGLLADRDPESVLDEAAGVTRHALPARPREGPRWLRHYFLTSE